MFFPGKRRQLEISEHSNRELSLPVPPSAPGSITTPQLLPQPLLGQAKQEAAHPHPHPHPTIPETHIKCLISALKLARAAWWTPFLVMRSSFSSASVSSVRFTFPSKLKSRACGNKEALEQGELPAGAWSHLCRD